MKIIHFHNGKGGGVLSVIKNLLEYGSRSEIENHVVYVINRQQKSVFKEPQLTGAVTSTVFYYSPHWNFYYTCKQLVALIPDDTCILIAHDWLELGAVTHLGVSNPVIQFVHGDYDYYYKLAVQHAASVNGFVCVSSTICKKLKQKLPARINDIAYLQLPVPDVQPATNHKQGDRIVFIGRCEKEKGYHLLPLIDEQLRHAGNQFEWHIYGEGSFDQEKQSAWSVQSKVSFYGNVPGEEVLKALPGYDFLVLPTIAEGMPLTVIEAMKAGVVPVVNHLPGGLEELIGNNERGFLIDQNSVENYTAVLQQLQQQPQLVNELSTAASVFARKTFDAINCTTTIEQFIKTKAKAKKNPLARRIYGSRLDQKWIPNCFVYFLRFFLVLSKPKTVD